jgi:hypothetical protein
MLWLGGGEIDGEGDYGRGFGFGLRGCYGRKDEQADYLK